MDIIGSQRLKCVDLVRRRDGSDWPVRMRRRGEEKTRGDATGQVTPQSPRKCSSRVKKYGFDVWSTTKQKESICLNRNLCRTLLFIVLQIYFLPVDVKIRVNN